jgi:hypothetical protein
VRLDHLLSKRKSRGCLTVEFSNSNISVAMRPGVTPVPISNTMVKTWTADGTILETVWESRWPPNFKENKRRGWRFVGGRSYRRDNGVSFLP